MPSQSKYIIKGLIRAVLLIAAIGAIYYGMNMKDKPEEKKPEIKIFSITDLEKKPEFVNGKGLFQNNCSSCHGLNKTDEMFLHKLVDSTYDRKTLYGWIRNSDSVVKSGNIYYKNLYNNYKVSMPLFPNLTDGDLDNILYYIKLNLIISETPSQ